MDKASLVNRVKGALFEYCTDKHVAINYFNLIPTYGEAMPNLFTLSVSAPDLSGVSCYQKTGELMNYLYCKLTKEETGKIAILRIFDSKDELKRQVSLSIIGNSCECERVLHVEPELVAV